MMHIISLGAGVQSSTMALMAAHGEITPMPDAAVFADTQAEPSYVYEYLDWLDTILPFPVHRVTAGSLENDMRGIETTWQQKAACQAEVTHIAKPTGKRTRLPAPFYTINNGQIGQLTRQCTKEYKVTPLHKWLRKFLGLVPRQRCKKQLATLWIGISADESHRNKLSKAAFVVNRHPLLELNMTRQQCLEWMDKNGYTRPQKSACYFCPYHHDSQWRDTKNNRPDEWERVVKFDKSIRFATTRGESAPVFLHRSGKPIDEIDFRSAEDAGQQSMFDEKGFAVECDCMCGV